MAYPSGYLGARMNSEFDTRDGLDLSGSRGFVGYNYKAPGGPIGGSGVDPRLVAAAALGGYSRVKVDVPYGVDVIQGMSAFDTKLYVHEPRGPRGGQFTHITNEEWVKNVVPNRATLGVSGQRQFGPFGGINQNQAATYYGYSPLALSLPGVGPDYRGIQF